MKVGDVMQLDWAAIDRAPSAWPLGLHAFRLADFNITQYGTNDWNEQEGSMAQAIWQFWLEGIGPVDTSPSDATVRVGWHYTRRPGNFAVLTLERTLCPTTASPADICKSHLIFLGLAR